MPTTTSLAMTSGSLSTTLPRMGLGMAALGRPGYINLDRDKTGVGDAKIRDVDHMRNMAETVMGRALELNDIDINSSSTSKDGERPSLPRVWFDCARSYGRSEEFVGDFLRKHNLSPKDVYVSSKWGYEYVADWNVSLGEGEPHEVKDHSVDMFLKQIKETEHHVGEYIRLYQVHSATFESGILTDRAVHDALYKCKMEKGWAIGLSVSSPRQDDILREAMKIMVGTGDKQQRLFDSVQCTYNLLEQKPGSALLEAHEAGMDIIIKEGMANGRLLQHPLLKEMCQREQVFTANNVTPDQIALASILAQPFQPRVLSGAVTTGQLESNFKALDVAETLKNNPSILDELMNGCVMPSDEYWSERASLAWN